MIKPSELIAYMRNNRSSDIWQVDYSATYQIALDKSKLVLPCFYMEVNPNTATIEGENSFLQLYTCNIRAHLICKSYEDRMGKTGADVAYYARLELWKIFLWKKLRPEFNEVYFVGDSFEGIDEARYAHVFDFSFTARIDTSNITLPNYDELKSIFVDYDLEESPKSEYPNTQTIINTLQD